MLMPRKVKHRKVQKKVDKRLSHRGATIAFGDYGLKSMEQFWMSSRQIEAARVTITRVIRKTGKLWIRVFPDKPITKKPAEVRMGKGKGSPEYWVCPVKPGKILFEVRGVDEETAKKALKKASNKLPVKTKFVSRKEFGE